MNKGVIVAASSDLAFATEVRDALGSAEIEIATGIGDFEGGAVLVLWSSSLSVDSEKLQKLIGLWAEGRLTIARRDDAALPLGLGDLDTLPPGAPIGSVVKQFADRIEDSVLKAAPPVPASQRTASTIANPPASAGKRAGRPGWRSIGAMACLSIVVVGGLFAYSQYQDVRGLSPRTVAAPPLDPGAAASRSPADASGPVPGAPRRPGIIDDKEALERAPAAQQRELEEAKSRRSDERFAADTASKRPRAVDDKEDTNERIVALERELEELNRQRRSEKLAADAASDRFATWVAAAIVGSVVSTSFGFWAFRRLRGRIPPASTSDVALNVAGPPQAAERDQADALFISYAHVDLQLIEPVLSEIDALGRRVWIDRSEMSGAGGWAGQIVAAIKRSRAVVLMASPRAYASHHVVRELYLAMSNNKTIVPLELEKAELPDEVAYILAPFQRHTLTEISRPILERALDEV